MARRLGPPQAVPPGGPRPRSPLPELVLLDDEPPELLPLHDSVTVEPGDADVPAAGLCDDTTLLLVGQVPSD